MRGDDRRLEQHRHGPFAEGRLERHEQYEHAGERRGLPQTPSRDGDGEDQHAERAGEIAVAHLLPCLGERIAIGDVGRHRLPVAERPVGATEAGIGEPHVRAHDDNDECERERRNA